MSTMLRLLRTAPAFNKINYVPSRGASRPSPPVQPRHRRMGLFYASNEYVELPPVQNEKLFTYEVGSPERTELKETLARMIRTVEDIPVVIAGEEYRTGICHQQLVPSQHKTVLANVHFATPELIQKAIDVSVETRKHWELTTFEHRIAVFFKAADLLSSVYRSEVVAATMLGQSKNPWQAEIDAAAETIDFLRFGCKYTEELYKEQPKLHWNNVWNRMAYRALEGFVAAISPFNFTAIGAHLCVAPAIVGNAVVWKPSLTAMLSNYVVFKVLKDAGLPDGVINFVPCVPHEFGNILTASPHLAAINFTGSTGTFKHLWRQVAKNLDKYHTYPRLIGECGGKNFHMVHYTADVDNVIHSTIRAAFEYQGQKCSACSRIYIPSSLWPVIKEGLIEEVKKIKVGHVEDFSILMGAVIDKRSFDKIKSYIDGARQRPTCEVLSGGKCDDSEGYFIEPTIIQTTDPKDPLMSEEIFGPVLTIFVYDDNPDDAWHDVCDLCNRTSPYALTGALFARDREAIASGMYYLREAAGNFYINDKSTGSVVGQQPFGGARLSGTNDKAGAQHYLLRFISPQSIKETTTPLYDWKYPHMNEP